MIYPSPCYWSVWCCYQQNCVRGVECMARGVSWGMAVPRLLDLDARPDGDALLERGDRGHDAGVPLVTLRLAEQAEGVGVKLERHDELGLRHQPAANTISSSSSWWTQTASSACSEHNLILILMMNSDCVISLQRTQSHPHPHDELKTASSACSEHNLILILMMNSDCVISLQRTQSHPHPHDELRLRHQPAANTISSSSQFNWIYLNCHPKSRLCGMALDKEATGLLSVLINWRYWRRPPYAWSNHQYIPKLKKNICLSYSEP